MCVRVWIFLSTSASCQGWTICSLNRPCIQLQLPKTSAVMDAPLALAMQWTTMNYNRQHKWGCRFCTWIFGYGSRHVKTGYPKIECLDTSKISWYLQMAKSCGPTFNFDPHLSGVKDILKVGTHTPSSGLRPVTEGSWFQMVEWSWRCWMLKTGWMQCYLCIPFVVMYMLLMSIFIWGLDWTLDL